MVLKKRFLILGLAFFLILFGYVFRETLFQMTMRGVISYYSQQWIGSQFAYRSIERKNGKIVLSDVNFQKTFGKDKGSCHVYSDEIEFSFGWNRKLTCYINFQRPRIVLLKDRDPIPLSFLSMKKKSLRLVQCLFAVEDGVMECLDPFHPKDSLKTTFFVQSPLSPPSIEAQVQIEDTSLQMQLAREKEGSVLRFQLEDIDLGKVHQFLSFFSKQIATKISEVQGRVNGYGLMGWKEEGLSRFCGNWSFENLSFVEVATESRLSFSSLKWEVIYPEKSSSVSSFIPHVPIQMRALVHGGEWISDGSSKWEDLEGFFSFNPGVGPKWRLGGKWTADSLSEDFAWEGKGYFCSRYSHWIETKCTTPQLEITARANELETDQCKLDVTIAHLNAAHFQMVQDFFASLFPTLGKMNMEKGEVSFSAETCFSPNRILSADIHDLSLSAFKGNSLWADLDVDQFYGDLLYEDREDPWQSWTADLHLESGIARILDYPQMKEISGDFFMEKGHFHPSSFYLKWADSSCSGVISDAINNSLIQLNACGKVGDLFSILPKLEVSSELAEDIFSTSFMLDLKGKLSGTFQLEKDERILEQIAFHTEFQPEAFFQQSWEKMFTKGWVRAEDVSLAKWTPFFPDQPLLNGTADFIARLVDENIWIQAKGEDLFFANSEVQIRVEQVAERGPEFFEDQSIELFYDLKEKTWDGRGHLRNAWVRLVEPKLDFEDANLDVLLSNKRFDIEVLQAKSHDLSFSGKVYLDLASHPLLEIFCPNAEGEIENVKTFLSHFDLNLFAGQPILGKAHTTDEGLYLRASFGPRNKDLGWSVQACLDHASCQISPSCSIGDFSGEFQWDSLTHSFLLVKGEGQFLVEGKDPLTISCPYFEYTEQKEDVWEFDFRLQKPTWDVLRLKGRAIEKENRICLHLNRSVSSFFGTNLNIEKCEFDSNFQIDYFEMSPTIKGENLDFQLDFLSHLRLLPFSNIAIDALHMEGLVDCHFEWKEGKAELAMQGNDLQVRGHTVENFLLKGKKDEKWNFEEVRIDDVEACFSLVKEKGEWMIPTFQAKYQDALSLDSSLSLNDALALQVHINQIEIDLEAWKSSVRQNLPLPFQDCKGVVHGKGDFQLQLQDPVNTWALDLKLDPAVLSIGRLRLHQSHPMEFHCSSESGFNINGLKMHFHHPDMDLSHFHVNVRNLFFSQESNLWRFDSSFHLPPSLFSFLESVARKSGTEHIIPLLHWAQQRLEWNQELDFSALLECSYDFHSFRLMIPEMDFLSAKHHLEDIVFQYDRKDCHLSFDYEMKNTKFRISTSVDLDDDITGNLLIADEWPAKVKPLIVSWEFSEEEGFKISTIQGAVCGMDAYFHEDLESSSSAMELVGSVKIDVSKLSHFLPPEMAIFFNELEMGKGYELRGKLTLDEERSSFEGILGGKQFELFGFQMKTLLSRVQWTPDKIEITDLKASDSAGIFKIDQLLIEKSQDRWELSIPSFRMTEFRPSLLVTIDGKQDEIKPLVIRELSLSKFRGWLDDITTFTGIGYLHFINSFKRGHTVFDLPADFFGRIIGLDLELLIPVKGTLEYELKNGKFCLTQMKETYSEGKRSKFFLVDGEEPPFLDFDGNLDIHIQMKQYVLFKITEAYILSIKGSLGKPQVSLERKKSFFSRK